MIGPVFVFTIPVALGLIHKEDYSVFAKGVMIGLIPIPAGAWLAGWMMGIPQELIFRQLIPVLLFTALIITGMIYVQKVMIQIFILLGKALIALTSGLLGIVAVQELTDVVIIEGMTPFTESMEIIGLIVLALAGAFPFIHFLKQYMIPFVRKHILRRGMDEEAAAGFISQFAHSIPMFKRLHMMSEQGKLVNISFAVSGAFVLGGHLGFTAAVEPEMVMPMITGKLTAGLLSAVLAYKVYVPR